MKRSFSLLVVAGCLSFAWAMPKETSTPEVGKVLLLDNDQMIEGDITRNGNEYSVKQTHGGEVSIPAKRGVKLAQSKQEIYQFLQSKLPSKDVDSRLKLARWAMLQQMMPEALEQAEAAVAINPKDSQARMLRDGIQKLIAKPINTIRPEPKKDESEEINEVVLPTNFNALTYPEYTTRIQPLLMNLCASCHAAGKGGNYKLVRGLHSNRKITLQNLAATIAYIDADEPSKSPLLMKAIMAHGGSSKAPVRDAKAPAYATLDAWVVQALVRGEKPKTMGGAVASESPLIVEEPMVDAKKPALKPPLLGGNVPVEPMPNDATPPKKETEKKSTIFADQAETVKVQTKPKDEFDPLIFNQQTPPKK